MWFVQVMIAKALLALRLLSVEGLHSEPYYVKPDGASSAQYFELLEKNTHIIYPALAILVLVLLVAGILQAWRTQDLDGLQKAELKREVILVLRRETHGAPVEILAREVGLTNLKLVKLLEELQSDGVVVSFTNTQRLTIWSLKGVPTPGRKYSAR